jgi:hypothetical protein
MLLAAGLENSLGRLPRTVQGNGQRALCLFDIGDEAGKKRARQQSRRAQFLAQR